MLTCSNLWLLVTNSLRLIETIEVGCDFMWRIVIYVTWWIIVTNADLWQLVTDLLRIFDQLWWLLTIFDNFWGLCDDVWWLLTKYDDLRQLVTMFDDLWLTVTNWDDLWQLRLTLGVWQSHRQTDTANPREVCTSKKNFLL